MTDIDPAARHRARLAPYVEAAPGPSSRRHQAPGPRLPLHLLLLLPRQADDLGAGLAGERYAGAAGRAAAAGARDPGPARGHRGAAGAHRLLRAARVGHGARHRRHPAPGAAAAGWRRHRRGRRDAPDRLLALRRLPVLHRLRAPPQHALAWPRRPGGVRAAGLPARDHGPLQARVPAVAAGRVRPGRRLLRARLGRPRGRHARLAVRLLRARPRADPDRDGRGEARVRRAPARLRRAGGAAAAPAHRGVRELGLRAVDARGGREVRPPLTVTLGAEPTAGRSTRVRLRSGADRSIADDRRVAAGDPSSRVAWRRQHAGSRGRRSSLVAMCRLPTSSCTSRDAANR